MAIISFFTQPLNFLTPLGSLFLIPIFPIPNGY
jgi:hypothetical protein